MVESDGKLYVLSHQSEDGSHRDQPTGVGKFMEERQDPQVLDTVRQ